MVEQGDFQPQPITIGKGVIIATTQDFVKGFQAGQDDYVKAAARHPQPYEDVSITELFLENLEDLKLSSVYSIGYAAGWLYVLTVQGGQS